MTTRPESSPDAGRKGLAELNVGDWINAAGRITRLQDNGNVVLDIAGAHLSVPKSAVWKTDESAAALPEGAEPPTIGEIARQYELVNEGGDWYWDTSVFGKHPAQQKLINEFLRLKSERSALPSAAPDDGSCEFCGGQPTRSKDICQSCYDDFKSALPSPGAQPPSDGKYFGPCPKCGILLGFGHLPENCEGSVK